MDRRRFLATTGTGLALSSTSGCLGLVGESSTLRPVDCSPFDDSQPSSGWFDSGSKSSSLNSVSGAWHSSHRDNQNSGYNPTAEGPSNCPSRHWSFRVALTDRHRGGSNEETYYSIQTSPIFHQGTLYFCDNENELYALNTRTGEIEWAKSLTGWYIYGPTYHDGILYLSAGEHLRAIHATSKEVLWSTREPVSDEELASQGGTRQWMSAAPTIADGYVFAGTGHGKFCAIEATSGEIVWSNTIEARVPFNYRGAPAWEPENGLLGPPVTKNGAVCIPSDNGRLYAFDMQSGERQWVFEPGGRFQAAAAIHGESVFTTTTHGIYSVSLADGSINWEYHAGVHYMSPAVDGETLVASAGPDRPNRAVVALNAQTGEEEWRIPAATGSDTSPSITGGTTVVGVRDGLLAIDIASGSPRWFARGGGNIVGAPLLLEDAVIAADKAGYVSAIQ